MTHRGTSSSLKVSRRDRWSIGSLIWIVWQSRRNKQSSKIPSKFEKFVTQSVGKACQKPLAATKAAGRAKVQVPSAHLIRICASFFLTPHGVWSDHRGELLQPAIICLTNMMLCFKGQVSDTNRRLQDAGREVRHAVCFCSAVSCTRSALHSLTFSHVRWRLKPKRSSAVGFSRGTWPPPWRSYSSASRVRTPACFIHTPQIQRP